MAEVVGAKIGNIITNDFAVIVKAARDDEAVQLLTRELMSFMSACDLGVNWTKMAEGPTLFLIDEKGEYVKN